MEYLNKTQCRELLRIQSKDTINKYLKTLGLFEKTRFSWEEIKRILELQIFLGLKHGRNGISDFEGMSSKELEQTFESYGVDVNARLKMLQKIHRDSVQLKPVLH